MSYNLLSLDFNKLNLVQLSWKWPRRPFNFSFLLKKNSLNGLIVDISHSIVTHYTKMKPTNEFLQVTTNSCKAFNFLFSPHKSLKKEKFIRSLQWFSRYHSLELISSRNVKSDSRTSDNILTLNVCNNAMGCIYWIKSCHILRFQLRSYHSE